MLEDSESREILDSITLYQLTRDTKYLHATTYDQYFHLVVMPSQDDVIIDGGAYIGDTAEIFASFLLNKRSIHSFEPSSAFIVRAFS
ncbi:hypothetical protein GCM10008014_30410 [Paenibacillus silvae]|uniref:FkbM family methyltransferase n=1 Tax=Paenibacillus silvae TaxID=1325358 RepID=A0ABQ1ZCR4_9BACL|nr:hypothetical protein [Paenibacillus silvae]GGH58113.1 hypothetical protein GCM10008014_30410 [Paenibacillus silvae]